MKTPATRPTTTRTSAKPDGKGAPMVDNRPVAARQRQMQTDIVSSPRQQVQQQKAAGSTVASHPNATDLPDTLKAGVENLARYSLDDVQVHYNSDKPEQLQAHAYAQGTDIHVAPGQEQHLPHEAWHVVQQKQGRVKPTMQLKDKQPVNDNAGLEAEADRKGAKSLDTTRNLHTANSSTMKEGSAVASGRVVQPKLNTSGQKTSGKAGKIKAEVTATIGRNKLGEMRDDIAILETSIAFRTTEQDQYAADKQSQAYKDHAGRIALETVQLGKLQTAYAAAKATADVAKNAAAATKAATPKTQEQMDLEQGGFTIVKRR